MASLVNKSIWEDFMYLKSVFPELEMSSVEANPRIARGSVILPGLRNKPREVRNALSFPIRVHYPDCFPNKEIEVYDAEMCIKWDIVPEEHRHNNPYGGQGLLCTHLPQELELVSPRNRSYVIVYNAVLLYLAYLEYVRTGKWPKSFKGWAHGDEGKRQFQREILRMKKE